MRKPTREKLSALAGKDAKWFAQWIALGLEDYLFERGGRKAFPGAENFIDQPTGSIAADLIAIGDCLAPRDRAAFRQGVVLALRELDFTDQRDVVTAAQLLELGGGLTVPNLASTIAEKIYTIPNTQDGRTLFNLAFDVADQLAPNEPQAVARAVRHMVSRDSMFQPALAGRALVALTASEPHDFPAHFEFLRRVLDQEYHRRSWRDPLEPAVARRRGRLIRNVAAKLFDESLLAYPCRPDGDPRPEERNWWLEALSHEKPELLARLEQGSFTQEDTSSTRRNPQEIVLDASGLSPDARLDNAICALGSAESDAVEEACEEERYADA